MKVKELIIIGGGPAGLSAAKMACDAGIETLIVDRSPALGGQLIKQTHKFFGSKKQHAKMRGIDIAEKLVNDLDGFENLEILQDATVVGLYPDKVLTILKDGVYTRYQAKAVIVATGASEKFLAFENNDLPGIYGAGAIQTLMNVYGVLPGQNVVMIGSGNIGLIVSYQLIQAGVNVKAIIEAAPSIGGYKVHASKVKRLGVPILTSTTIKKAIGIKALEAVEIISLDANWKEIEGTSRIIETDTLCISVGLSPMHQILSMVNAKTKFIPELGGVVAVVDEMNQTSVDSIFVCGDALGIEEASSAMMEGYLTGLYVAKHLGKADLNTENMIANFHHELDLLRDGPFGMKTNIGLKKLKEASHA